MKVRIIPESNAILEDREKHKQDEVKYLHSTTVCGTDEPEHNATGSCVSHYAFQPLGRTLALVLGLAVWLSTLPAPIVPGASFWQHKRCGNVKFC
jgi:hypothetical protein